MNAIDQLQPEKVFRFFREIAAIPHGSGNTEQIAQYCLDFASKRGLRAVLDKGGNVVIYAPATPGYENCPPIMIQGHMDMVCEKLPDCQKNMDTEGLDLRTDGEFLWAEGTTLGGDDGIALAYLFALLDSEEIPHPPIEGVITRDEETGMLGAEVFDETLIQSRIVLNIDSEEEGVLTAGCAGGIDANCVVPLAGDRMPFAHCYAVEISGLAGGHSGVDIGKGGANAFQLLAVLLDSLPFAFGLSRIEGGGKRNVIPQSACAVIGTQEDCTGALEAALADFRRRLAEEWQNEPDVRCTVQKTGAAGCLGSADTKCILAVLNAVPTGVQRATRSIPPTVLSSLNLGAVTLTENSLQLGFLIRSNSQAGKQEVLDVLSASFGEIPVTINTAADYPAWEFRENSPLRDRMTAVFRECYGRDPEIVQIHAGLECGILSQKLGDADLISFGPDIHQIHTPAERLDIASTARTWEYLKAVLRSFQEDT